MQAMLLSLILILATMVIQLGSFRQAVIVILVIPSSYFRCISSYLH